MRGFLLGLANGTICLAYCAPVVIPYLLGEGRSIKGNYWLLGQFLIGRLFGYLIFAVFAWALGLFLATSKLRDLIFGLCYLILAGFLIYYCFKKSKGLCAAEYFKGLMGKRFAIHHFLPIILGFLTGVNLCPPFLLAFTSAVSAISLLSALAFFSTFFLGTLVFFVPIPFLGFWKQNQVCQWIGKMAAGIIGVYYFIMGILILIGGMKG
jgi:hypothetical protein